MYHPHPQALAAANSSSMFPVGFSGPWRFADLEFNGVARMGRHTAVGVLLLAIHAATSASSEGAGFDCRPYFQTRTCPEIVICDTPKLSASDDQLSDAYDVLMKRLPASRAARLRNDQRAWLDQRKRCACDADCISSLYEQRLQELDEFDQ